MERKSTKKYHQMCNKNTFSAFRHANSPCELICVNFTGADSTFLADRILYLVTFEMLWLSNIPFRYWLSNRHGYFFITTFALRFLFILLVLFF